MSPRRSSRIQPPSSAHLAPPSRADSSSSASTHTRRSKSCDSTATDSTALTPVPDIEVKEPTNCAVEQPTDQKHDDDDLLDSDTSSSPRRSARNSGVAKPDYALVHAGDVDGPKSRKRRSSTASARNLSPVTTRSKRRRASERSSEVSVDGAASATPDIESPRLSPVVDELEGATKPVEQVTATADSSPLTSPPDTSFGSSIAVGSNLPPSGSYEALSGPAAAGEAGQAVPKETAADELEGEPVLDGGEPATPQQAQEHVKPASELVAVRSSRRLAGIVPAVPSKKRRTLAPPSPKDWFEGAWLLSSSLQLSHADSAPPAVIVRGDAYAVVTATALAGPRARSPSSSLVPLSIIRHDDFLPRHTFTSYRFSLLVAGEKPIRIKNVVVRLEGSKKKVSGPSADEVEETAGAAGVEPLGTGHWVAVLKGDKYRWMAP